MAGRRNISGARLIGAGLASLGGALAFPLGRWHGLRMRAELASRAAPVYRLETAHGPLAFRCTSAESVKAAARFVYDEPETVWWIDNIVQADDCVWDVGANVGLYALYAALRLGAGGEVVAFEPGADNYAALTRNVAKNPTASTVRCFCVALSDETRAAELHLTSQDAGRAAHVFGNADEGLTAEARPHTQTAIGFSADTFISLFGVRAPDHVKIDVDSIEERIIRGGADTFAKAQSLIVEINIGESGAGHKESLRNAIADLGFVEHAEISARFPDRRNRIFVRG